MHLESILQSIIIQTEKNKYCMTHLCIESGKKLKQKIQTYRNKYQIPGFHRRGVR